LGLLPVLVVIASFRYIKLTIFASIFAGVVSWWLSFVRPTLVSEYFHSNPLLPIVPRLMAGLIAHCGGMVAYSLSKGNIWTTSCVVGILGSIANTVIVLSSLYIFVPTISSSNATFWAYFVFVVPTASVELVVNCVLTMTISRVVPNRRLQVTVYE
jgi:uncharacterized membrane protein